MDDRTQIAAMCLQGSLSNSDVNMTDDQLVKFSVETADRLLAELARTAPPPQPEPLADVKVGDVLVRTGWTYYVIAVDYPIAVIQIPKTGNPFPYDLRENEKGCHMASAAILAGLK